MQLSSNDRQVAVVVAAADDDDDDNDDELRQHSLVAIINVTRPHLEYNPFETC